MRDFIFLFIHVIVTMVRLVGSAQWDVENEDESGGQFTVPTAAGVSALQSLGPNPNVAILLSSLGGLTASEVTGSLNIGNRAGCGSPCLIQVGQVIRSPKALSRSYEGSGAKPRRIGMMNRWHDFYRPRICSRVGTLTGRSWCCASAGI